MLDMAYRTLKLSQGAFALVDEDDYERMNAVKWTLSGKYAQRKIRMPDGSYTSELLHRAVLNAPRTLEVDHINGDGLDNRKINLRLSTRSQNRAHSTLRKSTKTGFKGVYNNHRTKKFRASIKADSRKYNIGTFATAEEAARAYDREALRLHGEFAVTNQMLGLLA